MSGEATAQYVSFMHAETRGRVVHPPILRKFFNFEDSLGSHLF